MYGRVAVICMGEWVALLALLALSHEVAPPTANLTDLDAGLEDLGLHFARGSPVPMPGVQAVMTNSFGFGGTNASLVFGKI